MPAGEGLVIMRPTSVSVAGAGSSASISSNGGVTFSSATSLSLNGVFNTSCDNYRVVVRYKASTTGRSVYARLRASGTDATGSNYVRQYIYATGSSAPSGGRSSTDTSGLGFGWVTNSESAEEFHIYGPALAQPTASRSINVYGGSAVEINDWCSTHNLSTSYDGFTIFDPGVASLTGNLVVFGYEE